MCLTKPWRFDGNLEKVHLFLQNPLQDILIEQSSNEVFANTTATKYLLTDLLQCCAYIQ